MVNSQDLDDGKEEAPVMTPEDPSPPQAAPGGRSRHWMATWNNPPADGFTQLKGALTGLRYLIGGSAVPNPLAWGPDH